MLATLRLLSIKTLAFLRQTTTPIAPATTLTLLSALLVPPTFYSTTALANVWSEFRTACTRMCNWKAVLNATMDMQWTTKICAPLVAW